MKRFTMFLMMFFITTILYAAEADLEMPKPVDEEKISTPPLTLYKPMYIVFGNMNDQVKGQFSFKYDILSGIVDYSGLYGGYTQTMAWDLYEKSSPFIDVNFNPELFWKIDSKKNVFSNFDFKIVDYFQLGLCEHKSNGKNELTSRSWERSYAQVQLSYGATFNFGLNYKYFAMYTKNLDETNSDVQDYIGSWEAMLFIKYKAFDGKIGKGELYAKVGPGGGINGYNFKKGWQEYGIIFPSFLPNVRAYIQIFHGYGEFLFDYNVKNDTRHGTAIRIGLISK